MLLGKGFDFPRRANEKSIDGGYWKPSKKKSRERIDGIVALIMGLEGASQHEEFTGAYWILGDGVTI